MYYPSQQEFLKLSRKGNIVPVYKEILGDLETPVSAYCKLAKSSRYSFLLESVEGEEKIARFSFVAADPELVFQCKKRSAKILTRKNGKYTGKSFHVSETPFTSLRKIMSAYKSVDIPGLPRFCGGMVGYIGYDVVRFFERLPLKTKDDLNLPDILLVLTKKLLIFDHRNHKIMLVSCAKVDPKSSAKTKVKKYQQTLKEIDALASKLQQPFPGFSYAGENHTKLRVRSNLTETKFKNMVLAAKKEITKGEIIQAVLSQRFEVPIKTDPLNIYRALRVLNPSPYMYYLNFDGVQIIGSSPELLVRCEDGIVETRPIAGTRPRGKNDKEDQAFSKDLLNDPKEKAEHIMLVDLGRNDLGRVCERGTVEISEFMCIEKYSHVMHIVSNVIGKLRKGMDAFDILQAAFPAGTVSGAPKIRAMEIIEGLEQLNRGPYAGAIGYFSFSGNLDTCITIRTIVVYKNRAYTQAGAGIVADSNPQTEYKETVNKARAQIMAIEKAHQQVI